MNTWNEYPSSYRSIEVNKILQAVKAGECVAILGLSGSGKSNLSGFLTHRINENHPFSLVDINRLSDPSPDLFYRLLRTRLGDTSQASDDFSALEKLLDQRLHLEPGKLCLILDRFDALPANIQQTLAGPLRSLRDEYKYQLTYLITSRKPLSLQTELAELFFAHTFWLGPLSPEDARWNIQRYAARLGLVWPEEVVQQLLDVSWGYPSLLKATCQAYAATQSEFTSDWRKHPAVERCLDEFWMDQPDKAQMDACGLSGHPWLSRSAQPDLDVERLTAKEYRLLQHFQQNPGDILEKDALILAVWPEDQVFTAGLRDDSLAQLIRRLRRKIESDPSAPQHILTIPGRGYRYMP